jgi:hypothetical protein
MGQIGSVESSNGLTQISLISLMDAENHYDSAILGRLSHRSGGWKAWHAFAVTASIVFS